jgi:hypothetical protein
MENYYLSIFAVSISYIILLIFNMKILKKTGQRLIILLPFVQLVFIWYIFWEADNFIEISAVLLGSLLGFSFYFLAKRSLKYFGEIFCVGRFLK